MRDDARVSIDQEPDIVTARQEGRDVAAQLGFPPSALALIATAISEITRNVIEYARRGDMVVRIVRQGGRAGVEIVVEDEGPGIPNVEMAMHDGYSTGGGLGLGLPGAKRLMDEFEIDSRVGGGTRIVMRKWAQ